MNTEKEKLINFFHASGLVSFPKAEEIAEPFVEKTLTRNDFFLKEGSVSNEYLFLEEGFIRSFAYNLNGVDITTGFYTKLNVVFEVSSFFSRTASRENIQALTDCKGWCISYQQLNVLFHTIPDFREFGRSILVKGFSALKTRMLSMITETAEEPYANLLNTNPEIFQHAPLKNIATYLGITYTTFIIIRKEFSKK
jgi:CRP-like cAMP-binding protein